MDYEMEEEETKPDEPPPVRLRTGMFEGPIKCLDTGISMGSNSVSAINLVQLGNSFTQRIGRRIQISRETGILFESMGRSLPIPCTNQRWANDGPPKEDYNYFQLSSS